MKKNKFYITTPIYYVNSKPHLGTLYSTLLADVAARWHKLKTEDVFFLTGTDEHGQKIQEKAEEVGMDPKAFCDSMIPGFEKVWKQYGIEYNKFIRTTDEYHEKAVVNWIKQLHKQGDIYKSTYTGLYCVPCENFIVASHDSEQNEEGKSVCPIHKRVLDEIAEESYFFRLSAYQDQLLEFYEKNPNFITPQERMQEVLSFVKSGLKDLSISRKSVSWGIPFPGDSEHTVYVWGDALNNYITAIGYGQSDKKSKESFEHWWPADVHVMAKDIVRFHAVYWPAFLMAAGVPLPKKLLVHGFILMGQDKMSKSRGGMVDPGQLAEWCGVEPVRYYLMRQMPISHDGQFTLKELEERISGDLANNLGNLLNRTLVLARNNKMNEIVAPEVFEPEAAALRKKCKEMVSFYSEEMDKYHYHIALAQMWKFISEVNAFFHAQEPWKLAKENKELFVEIISAVCHSLYTVGSLLWPVMPNKMEELLAALGHTFDIGSNYEAQARANEWKMTFTLQKMDSPLFTRPEIPELAQDKQEDKKTSKEKEVKKVETPDQITIHDFIKVKMIVGTIKACEPVKGSDKLYKLQVDLGKHGMRQIFSGIAKDFTPEQLIGKQGTVVANLAPRKMMGEESQGMMLFAKNEDGSLRLLTVGEAASDGSLVS
ncbi:MAG: methionine--tRNA ligase [Epsilonproteobacteria bacterium]|nr:methionine--tRNA ligase [Campylobacterota bacterium]